MSPFIIHQSRQRVAFYIRSEELMPRLPAQTTKPLTSQKDLFKSTVM